MKRTPIAAVLVLAAALGSSACVKKKTDTGVRTIESKDWFRDGKDRFYLAQLASGAGGEAPGNVLAQADFEGTQDGQEVLVGLGCVKEKGDYWNDEDPYRPGQKYFTRRYYSTLDGVPSDFPMAKDPKNPGPGECVVLFGDHQIALTHAALKKSTNAAWAAGNALVAPMGVAISVATCATCVSAIAGAATGRFSKSAVGIACAGAGLASFGISGVTNGFMFAIGSQKAHEALGGTALSLLPCGDLAEEFWYYARNKKRETNRKVFFDTLGTALTKSLALVLAEDPSMKDFLTGRTEQFTQQQLMVKLRKINNRLTPYFNGAFGNRDTFAHMEQGWGTFKETTFFDNVREINEEMKAALEAAGAAQGGGNGAVEGGPADGMGNGAPQ